MYNFNEASRLSKCVSSGMYCKLWILSVTTKMNLYHLFLFCRWLSNCIWYCSWTFITG